MSIVDDSFGNPLKYEEGGSALLAGGIMAHGFQCGMLWGAALAAGAQAYRLYGPGPQAESACLAAAQRLVDSFRSKNSYIDCGDITEMDWQDSKGAFKFIVKGGPIKCFRMAAVYAPDAAAEISSVFSRNNFKAPPPPVSCAAEFANKSGASEQHAVMAAGFAGGIGLSGSACGVLGAALWLTSMNSIKNGGSKIDLQNSDAIELIDRFVKSSDYEFECSQIVGRKFENISDHSEHLRAGGCSQIIQDLAEYTTSLISSKRPDERRSSN